MVRARLGILEIGARALGLKITPLINYYVSHNAIDQNIKNAFLAGTFKMPSLEYV